MKILHVIEPFASGITTCLMHITRYLPQHQHIVLHGTRTSVDSLQKVRNRFPPEVEFHKWKWAQREVSLWADLRSLFFLIRFIEKTEFDVIHLHSSKAGFLGRLASFITGKKKIIYSPHAGSFIRTDIGFLAKRVFVTIEKIGYHLNNNVIGCCEAEQEDYKRIGLNINYISNGTPSYEIPKKDPSKLVIIFSGLVTRQKDPSLFNKIALAFKDNDLVEFFWIGDGELRNELTSSNIKITGWLENDQTLWYYQMANVYLATSSWEGLPYGVLEAMGASCCLLLTPCGGHVNLVQNDINGYLIPDSGEAIKRIQELIDNPEKTRQLGKKSKEIVSSKFTVQKMVDQYDKYYRNLA